MSSILMKNMYFYIYLLSIISFMVDENDLLSLVDVDLDIDIALEKGDESKRTVFVLERKLFHRNSVLFSHLEY